MIRYLCFKIDHHTIKPTYLYTKNEHKISQNNQYIRFINKPRYQAIINAQRAKTKQAAFYYPLLLDKKKCADKARPVFISARLAPASGTHIREKPLKERDATISDNTSIHSFCRAHTNVDFFAWNIKSRFSCTC